MNGAPGRPGCKLFFFLSRMYIYGLSFQFLAQLVCLVMSVNQVHQVSTTRDQRSNTNYIIPLRSP